MRDLMKYMMAAGICLVAASCVSGVLERSRDGGRGLSVDVALGKMNVKATGGQDMSAETGFGQDDVIGLFSEGGNLDPGSGGKLVNVPMKFDSSKGENGYVFVNEEVNADVNQLGKVYLYYPYAKGAEQPGGASVVDPENGRVYDFLIAYDDWGAGYVFYHAFCKLRIRCGEGFDAVAGQKISVFLENPADSIRIVDNGGGDVMKKYEFFGKRKEFEAWKVLAYDGEKEYEAYEVILPSSSDRTTRVDHIELMDNDGNIQELRLTHEVFDIPGQYDPHGYLKPSYVFPVTVKMENLVPVVRGGSITPWGEDESITVERTYGINDDAQFSEWAGIYNSFIKDFPALGSRPSVEEIADEGNRYHDLLNYGTYVNKRWNFHVGADLDLSQNAVSSVCIMELCDTLSGANHTLSNIFLKGSGMSGFIGTLSEGGCLQDMRLSALSIADDAASGGLCGGIAARMTGGTVTNCRVTGISLRCASGVYAGAFAGEMTGGTVEYSSFRGSIMGGTSSATGQYARILGKNPSDDSQVKVEEVDATNVIIMK